MTVLLEAEAVSLKRGGCLSVDGASLSLSAGDFVALVGPNGAGKTTFLELLRGCRRPSAGRVTLQGQPIGSLSHRERARLIALLGRESFAVHSLRVSEVVALGRLPHRVGWSPTQGDHVKVQAALARFGLEAFSQRPFHTLSDGERQRVHWARAYCQETAVLLMDEATAHMDIATRERTFAFAREFTEAGGAALAVAHELDLAVRHATRIVVMHEGRFVAEGRARDVLTSELLASVFGIDARVVETERATSLQVFGVNK